MARIWRGLKLGMKSLLLHKLRSGLTVLGIVFGVAAVISMLAVGEGSSRDAQVRIQQLGATNIMIISVKPSEETQAQGGRPARVLNYGLKYDDFEHSSPPCRRSRRRAYRSARSASRSATSITPSMAASSARPRVRRVQPPRARPRPVPHRG